VEAAKAAGMRCVGVAQSFPVSQLQRADLVRLKISDVTVDDLTGTSASSLETAEPPQIQTSPQLAPPAKAGPWGFWITVGFSAVIAIAIILVQLFVAVAWLALNAALGHQLPPGWESQGLLLAVATCASAPAAVGLAWLFAWLRRTLPVSEYLGLRAVTVGVFAKWSVLLLLMVAVSDGLTMLLGRPVVPEVMQEAYRTAGFTPLLWVAVVLIAPVEEETLFRGFIFTGLKHSRLGSVGAVLLTSLAWSLIHVQYDAYGIGTVFVSGLLLGYARFKTGSVYLTVWLHALMNFIATVETAWIVR